MTGFNSFMENIQLNARLKLNSANIVGILLFACLLGWVTKSLAVFALAFVIQIALAVYSGDIRTHPKGKNKPFRSPLTLGVPRTLRGTQRGFQKYQVPMLKLFLGTRVPNPILRKLSYRFSLAPSSIQIETRLNSMWSVQKP